MWHVSSRSHVATFRTAIHLLLVTSCGLLCRPRRPSVVPVNRSVVPIPDDFVETSDDDDDAVDHSMAIASHVSHQPRPFAVRHGYSFLLCPFFSVAKRYSLVPRSSGMEGGFWALSFWPDSKTGRMKILIECRWFFTLSNLTMDMCFWNHFSDSCCQLSVWSTSAENPSHGTSCQLDIS